MPRLTPILALDIAKAVDGSDVLMREDGREHLKYAYRVRLPGPLTRELSIVREPTADGVTVYLNKQSCAGDRLELLEVRKRFPGVRGLEEYPKGYVGKTGDKGISSAAGGCPSLLPLNNDVLRVSCSDTDGFGMLVSWYAGVTTPRATSPRHEPLLSASPSLSPSPTNPNEINNLEHHFGAYGTTSLKLPAGCRARMHGCLRPARDESARGWGRA